MLPRFLVALHKPAPREQLRRFLMARGFDVEVAVDGLQCLAQLREGPLTVLVLDPQLPWGGGDGVLECLLDEEPFQNVTVVLANGGHFDEILPRLRPLITECHHCPSGLHDMEDFLACLEQLAWRIDRETSEDVPDLNVRVEVASSPVLERRGDGCACDGSVGTQSRRG